MDPIDTTHEDSILAVQAIRRQVTVHHQDIRNRAIEMKEKFDEYFRAN